MFELLQTDYHLVDFVVFFFSFFWAFYQMSVVGGAAGLDFSLEAFFLPLKTEKDTPKLSN